MSRKNEAAVALALEVVLALLRESQAISTIIQTAIGEGRQALTDDEWARIEAGSQSARDRLVAAIEAREAEPPATPVG
jgi:hypothetical protein